jgi:predicted PurR-regulated permease PerM
VSFPLVLCARLLVVIGVGVAVGIGLLAAMLRRDEPHLGAFGMIVLVLSGIPAAAYAAL